MSARENIVLVPTTNCNAGCLHCMHNADMNGSEISIECIQKMLERLHDEKIEADFQITGMGEPLQYSRFDTMISLILENCKNSELAVITSGYESWETEKQSRLLRMIELVHGKQFLLALSYNLFSNFERRMHNVLRDLAFQDHDLEVLVKMCMSAENDKETVESFAHLLVAIARENNLPDVSYCGSISWGINVAEHLREQLYVLHGSRAEIRIQTKLWGLKREGRAKKLKGVSFLPSVCELLPGIAERSLTLYPDGYFYPCDGCVGNSKRRLGHVMHDSMVNVIRKRDSFVRKIGKYIWPFWIMSRQPPCWICKNIPI